jgi:acylphosphatase
MVRAMMSQSLKKSIHIRVWGRVQGVGFRAFVAQQADLLGVTGWVRNIGWNQVETRAEGHEEVLKAFLEIVKKGPAVSRVEKHEVVWDDFGDRFDAFQVRWF